MKVMPRMRSFGFVMRCCLVLSFIAPGFAQSRINSTSPLQPVWENDSPAKLGQSARIGGGSIVRENFGFYWETRIEPVTPALASGFSTRASTDSTPVIHRVLLDSTGRSYFGYDVLVDVLPGTSNYRITFQPLVMTRTLAKGWDMDVWSSWVPLAAPRFPPPQTVHGGEILELTLLTNDATKQRIVDYVSIQEPSRTNSPFEKLQAREFSFATGTPRDITSNDVEMRVQAPRLNVNGKLVESTATRNDTAAGAFIWIYLPNHGRFVLSLGPHADLGFRNAGEIRGSSLLFKDGSDSYTISAGAPIAPGQSAFNLYVLHQANWKPTYPSADESVFSIGGVDRFEALDK